MLQALDSQHRSQRPVGNAQGHGRLVKDRDDEAEHQARGVEQRHGHKDAVGPLGVLLHDKLSAVQLRHVAERVDHSQSTLLHDDGLGDAG